MAQTGASKSIEPLSKCKAYDLATIGADVPQLNDFDIQSALGKQSRVIGFNQQKS
jgi:hypothetical protein